MSMTGMLLVTEERLPEGEPVEIKVVLTGTEPPLSLDFNGRVSRIIENGMGITFEKIDLDSYIHLKNIVSYNTDDPEKVQDEIWHSIDEKLVAEK